MMTASSLQADLDDRSPALVGSVSQMEKSFTEALAHLLAQLKDDDARKRVILSSIDAMARSYENPHTSFLAPAYWQNGITNQSLSLGFSCVDTGRGRLVWDVIPDSPASKAGMRPGDIVESSTSQAVLPGGGLDLLKPLQPIDITVRRGGMPLQIEVGFEGLVSPAIDWGFLPGNIAYMRIYTFGQPPGLSAGDIGGLLSSGLAMLSSFDGPSGWIIDLRNNAGGSSHFAAHLAGLLGAEGRFIEHVSRSGTEYVEVPDEVLSMTRGRPVVAITNGQTASSAEALVQILKEQNIAYVIGGPTQGAVFGASTFEVAGGALQIATARAFVGASRLDLNGVGVAPDQVVPLRAAGLEASTQVGLLRNSLVASEGDVFDSQLQAAVDSIRQR